MYTPVSRGEKAATRFELINVSRNCLRGGHGASLAIEKWPPRRFVSGHFARRFPNCIAIFLSERDEFARQLPVSITEPRSPRRKLGGR